MLLAPASMFYIFADLFSGADFRFANYYGNSMVLQRAPASAVVWGYAAEVNDVITLKIHVDGKERVYQRLAVAGTVVICLSRE